MVHLHTTDPAHVLYLGDEENRFTPSWLSGVDDALDRVVDDPRPLVTVGTGRFYSNGLDLDWIAANPSEMVAYVDRVHVLLARVLTLPVPTVAAVNGHAFGAGAMLAMAHDWRLMRSDRGYLCFPEVDIHVPFTPGMAALIQAKVTQRTAIDAMTTGRRFPAPDAIAAGLVDDEATAETLVDAAIAKVAELGGKDPVTLGAIKTGMFPDVLRQLGATA